MSRENLIEVMARAWVREEAAQMGEPDPWPESLDDPRDRQIVEGWLGYARSAYDALREAGLVVVPEEPTEAMRDAGRNAFDSAFSAREDGIEGDAADWLLQVYRAMIAAHTAREGLANTAPVKRRAPCPHPKCYDGKVPVDQGEGLAECAICHGHTDTAPDGEEQR